ncbi:hypothetical protein [Chamaesiphon sp. VAR_48_metabat_135_sub]|uniref:hypothetical protein n=1 Tax=Chamaesiphon sp. VAR_48_metabat_135_sub TaxID=2964699 RepID=UPI00286A9C5F|nr:hypothetical protein [Chamaesiphon sp. VAR_48_metabat_135_sub]
MTNARTNQIIPTWIVWLLYISVFPLLFTYLIVSTIKITLTSEGISGSNIFCRRQYIDWQAITLVKPYCLFGIRCLSVKTVSGKNIQLTPHFHQTDRMLDRVRELAGEEHILVRALEKELSRPRRELTKLWFRAIGSIALTISIYLVAGNMYAADREKPLESAIANYVRQHPKTAPNQSAIELQALMTKLGLSVENFGDGSKAKVRPKESEVTEWRAIEPTIGKYVDKQLAKNEDSIEPVPSNISKYLRAHQPDLAAIKTHLIDNPLPQWGLDTAWIERSNLQGGDSPLSPLMKYLDLMNTENLLIINILDKQQLPNTDISKDLAAIEKIQQSLQVQPSFLGQLVSRIGEKKISRLVRQIDKIPSDWGNNLFDRIRHEQMRSAIEGESMITSRALQDSYLFNQLLISLDSPLRFIPGFYQLARPQIRLFAVERYAKTQAGLAYWGNQNICRTDGKTGIIESRPLFGLADDALFMPTYVTSQYSKVLINDLRWELANSVRQVRAELVMGEKVNLLANKFNWRSTICPREQWTAKATEGAVTIAFSHPPDWKALDVNKSNDIELLTYKIKSIDRK